MVHRSLAGVPVVSGVHFGYDARGHLHVFQELADMQVIARSVSANLAAMRTYRSMLQNVLQNMGK